MQLRIDRADLGEAVLIIDGPSGALGSSTGSRSASCSAAVAAAIAGMPVAGGTRLMVGSCLKGGVRGPQMWLVQEILGRWR